MGTRKPKRDRKTPFTVRFSPGELQLVDELKARFNKARPRLPKGQRWLAFATDMTRADMIRHLVLQGSVAVEEYLDDLDSIGDGEAVKAGEMTPETLLEANAKRLQKRGAK